jgi:hypothetical protein
MARYTSHKAVVLLVGVVAFAMLVNVEAFGDVKPVGNCWTKKIEGQQNVTRFFFGYDSSSHSPVIVPVSENNYFTSIVELGADPITSFIYEDHGLSQVVTVPEDLALNMSIAVHWILNGMDAVVDSSNATQECPSAEDILLVFEATSATQSANETLLASAITAVTGMDEAHMLITSTVGMSSVFLNHGSQVSVFEATLAINQAFVNLNDESFRASLKEAFKGADVTNVFGGSTAVDQPSVPIQSPPSSSAPSDPAPSSSPSSAPSSNPDSLPTIVPIAHCWEPTTNASLGFSFFYFGYYSTFKDTQFIQPDTPLNTWVGAPTDAADPFPVFYPGINGFVSRLRVPDGSVIQWNLNGYAVLLDGANVDDACDASANEGGLTSVAAFPSGSFNDSSIQAAVDAMSDVARLPIANVQATWANVFGGGEGSGFRGLFNLTAGNEESVYTAMWRTVSDYHLSNSTLNMLWTEAFGVGASNYSNAGTAGDELGQPLPPTDSSHKPIAHCWVPGSAGQNSKYAYFGYSTNYQHSLSYLQGPNNWIANVDGWTTPTILYPNYNGFAVSVVLNGDNQVNSANVAWNLAGQTASLDLSNSSLQCPPTSPVGFTVTYTGVLLESIDQVTAAAETKQFVLAQTGMASAQVQFDAFAGGFMASIILTPTNPNTQYEAMTSFLTSCNSLNSMAIKSALSSFAGNATVLYCQSVGIGLDALGRRGTTPETKGYGLNKVTLTLGCWNPNGNGITAYFGYTSTSPFSYFIPTTVTTAGGAAYDAEIPLVFSSQNDPYAARISSPFSPSVSWTLGGQTVTLSAQDTGRQCSANVEAHVTLAFERTLTSPPGEVPIIEWISQLTGYPDTSIDATWTFDSNSDFILNVIFKPINSQQEEEEESSSSFATTEKRDSFELAKLPIPAATFLVRQLVDNATATAGISAVAGCHLYSASTGQNVEIPVSPSATPSPSSPSSPASPSSPTAAPSSGKKLGGALVFGIIIAVLLGVAIIGGVLFYFCKYHKGMCKDDLETRPLLQD